MIKIFTSQTQSFGEKGENEAVTFLKKNSFTVIDRNVANKFGEIDIIAKKSGVYHFFEVKTGKRGGSVLPAENLTKAKIRKYLMSVEYYCMKHSIGNYEARGLVVLFDQNSNTIVEIIDLF